MLTFHEWWFRNYIDLPCGYTLGELVMYPERAPFLNYFGA